MKAEVAGNWIALAQTIIGLIGTAIAGFGLYALWKQLKQANEVSKAQSYVNIRATLAQLNQTLINHDVELGTEFGEDKKKAFFDMISAYYEMPFILRRLGVIDDEVFKVERRSLRHLLRSQNFRIHCEGRIREELYDKEFLTFLKQLLSECASTNVTVEKVDSTDLTWSNDLP